MPWDTISLPEHSGKAVPVALGNATGTAWFDDISLRILDQSGTTLARKDIKGPMDEGG